MTRFLSALVTLYIFFLVALLVYLTFIQVLLSPHHGRDDLFVQVEVQTKKRELVTNTLYMNRSELIVENLGSRTFYRNN